MLNNKQIKDKFNYRFSLPVPHIGRYFHKNKEIQTFVRKQLKLNPKPLYSFWRDYTHLIITYK